MSMALTSPRESSERLMTAESVPTLQLYNKHAELARSYSLRAEWHDTQAAEIWGDKIQSFDLSPKIGFQISRDPLLSGVVTNRNSGLRFAQDVAFPVIVLLTGLAILVCGIALGELFYCVAGTCAAIAAMAHLAAAKETEAEC